VLPLLALPFALAIDSFKAAAYKVIYLFIYAVLLLTSFAVMYGFIYQPRWMYNQPSFKGQSSLLVYGLSDVLSKITHQGPGVIADTVTSKLPNFVWPYFSYLDGKVQGDAAVAAAWQASVLPGFIIFLIVVISLGLYALQQRPRRPASVQPVSASSPMPGLPEAG